MVVPAIERQQCAHHDRRLQLQLGAHEDGPGPQIGIDRLAHQVLDPVSLLGFGGRRPHGHQVGDRVGHHPGRLGVMVFELFGGGPHQAESLDE